jgi:sporulation protein YlmC with PRC-barrel domain
VQPAREPLLRVPVRLLRVTDKAVVVDADGLAQPVYIVPPAATPGIHRASSLMDKRVDDVSGREVGRITDVVIDLSRQKVHYTVLDFNPQSGFSTALAYAVPIESLIIRGAEPDRIALAVPQQRLAGLAGFDASRWPELNDPRHLATIERSFGTLVPRRGAVGAAR